MKIWNWYLISLTLCSCDSTDQCGVVRDFRTHSSQPFTETLGPVYHLGVTLLRWTFWTALGPFFLWPSCWRNQPVCTAETGVQAQHKVVSNDTWRDEGIHWSQHLDGHWLEARNRQLLANRQISENTACVSTGSFWTSNEAIPATATTQLGYISM